MADPRGNLELRTLAMPANTNPSGDVFGGWIMSLMDLAAGMSGVRHCGGRVVTAAASHLAFLAPVKVGEYLLCGTPVVGAAAIGRNEGAVRDGVFFDDAAGMEAAADWFVGRVLPERAAYRERARRAGVAHYSLRRSVDDYSAALDAACGTEASR